MSFLGCHSREVGERAWLRPGISYYCAASVLPCAEDNVPSSVSPTTRSVPGRRRQPVTSSQRMPPATADGAAEGFLVDHPVQFDDCVMALVETKKEHMPADGYPQMLRWPLGDLDLAAVRRDAIDWIWKVSEHFDFAPLTALLSVNYLR
uniref:Cyclin N-terminal domain-containing protein n=1 Tax=Aegilops tauschii TaxID=37682 RepID=R7W5X6_AEGTA